jgi:putative peptide zinc metalloprotease protein
MLVSMNKLPPVLPPLREDIHLQEGGRDFNGGPTWLIHDKVSAQFFHLGWKEYEILRHWQAIAPDEFLIKLKKDSLVEATEEDLVKILHFLSTHCLIEQNVETMQKLYQKQHGKKPNFFLYLAKNYLFFRVPLVHPNDFLDKIYPYTRFIFTKSFALIMLFFALMGLILLMREWTQFTHTFFAFLSFKYILLYAIALVCAKSFHEFGHALMTKKYGLNIPSMGVAFLVMFPMLYTDTQESWQIKSPKERINIALAGVMMEVYIAIIAIWLWLFLPDGALKSICFFLATYSLLTTLLINISPFLRFDGYHVLSDLLSMRNLQTRSFALMRWRLRKLLFGFKDPAPEVFTAHKQKILILYAVATLIYRFVLFLSIAILVYYLFFKMLGIVLFAIEIIYFILLPIYRELKAWYDLRTNIRLNQNTVILSATLVVLLGVLFIPWQSTVSMPATLSYQSQTLFSELPAKVKTVRVKKGQQVKAGDVLVVLESPEIDFRIQKTRYQIEEVQWQLRNIAHFQKDLQQQETLKSTLRYNQTELQYLREKKASLIVKAPFSGVIESLSEDMRPNAWVKKRQAMMILVNKDTVILHAYPSSADYERLQENQQGQFIPENIDLPNLQVGISNLSKHNVNELYALNQDHAENRFIRSSAPFGAYHASNLGGSIAVTQNSEQQIIPNINTFIISLKVSPPVGYPLENVVRGKAFITVDSISIASYITRHILIFFVKESGF